VNTSTLPRSQFYDLYDKESVDGYLAEDAVVQAADAKSFRNLVHKLDEVRDRIDIIEDTCLRLERHLRKVRHDMHINSHPRSSVQTVTARTATGIAVGVCASTIACLGLIGMFGEVGIHWSFWGSILSCGLGLAVASTITAISQT